MHKCNQRARRGAQQWWVAAAAARLETEAAGGLPRQRGLGSVVPLAELLRGSCLAAGRFTGHGRSLNF